MTSVEHRAQGKGRATPTDTDAIPAELRALDQWVNWRREDRGAKTTKVPVQATAPQRRASSTDAATWGSYEDARRTSCSTDGIGFVFSSDDPYVGVDLDNCVDGGIVHPAVATLIAKLDSYTELSPSGSGLHIIVRATMNGGRKKTEKTPWKGAFENYSSGRFFCVTGSHWQGTPTTVNDRQAELDAVRAELLPPPAPRPPATTAPAVVAPALTDDDELLSRAFGAANGEEFGRLFNDGDTSAYAGDHSRADLALCGLLAFWTGRDRGRIDRLFRRSHLMRAKWDDRRGEATYGEQTIDKALEGKTTFYGDPIAASPTVPLKTSTEKGKLSLPDMPADTDAAGRCAWVTCVFNLSRLHPITGGEWQGQRGPEGQIVLHRAGAPDLRIEPAKAISSPTKLIESFVGRKHPGDGMLPAFTAAHCRQISHVVQLMCDTSGALSEQEEAIGIIGTFLQSAEPNHDCTTYGTSAQRHEAAWALRPGGIGQPRYLIDTNTGEHVIAVSDLARAGREHVGSTLPRGWLDGRMANLGWDRAILDGHAEPGRGGKTSHHASVNVYRGHLVPVTK